MFTTKSRIPCSNPKRKLNKSPDGGGVPVVELVVEPVVVEPVVVEPVVVEPVVVEPVVVWPVVDEFPFELPFELED
ncbi:hypothetical protein MTY66_12150 [Mycolicibacterium sp. TY66]|uniref:hypothetical protein n=1 Tax=unclassified Mycolicibacterium TaxID=2636767 RepID=UPI001BB42F44|nr:MULTISPECIES: hypothetical protein [unclassified Mycolicibacterium]BCI79590.1 hypothetical protein MTY66_12150 [Mycolicibacterium sp. TY66]BCJ82746.1 hypothetical protein MTY81_41190 [Mycolicibacterium sp. TY81]